MCKLQSRLLTFASEPQGALVHGFLCSVQGSLVHGFLCSVQGSLASIRLGKCPTTELRPLSSFHFISHLNKSMYGLALNSRCSLGRPGVYNPPVWASGTAGIASCPMSPLCGLCSVERLKFPFLSPPLSFPSGWLKYLTQDSISHPGSLSKRTLWVSCLFFF